MSCEIHLPITCKENEGRVLQVDTNMFSKMCQVFPGKILQVTLQKATTIDITAKTNTMGCMNHYETCWTKTALLSHL